MKYITRDKQDPELKRIIYEELKEFAERYPSKTIGHHHYVRVKHIEQFIYTLITKL